MKKHGIYDLEGLLKVSLGFFLHICAVLYTVGLPTLDDSFS
jgi:hypothetical protein